MAPSQHTVLQKLKNGRRTYGVTFHVSGGFIRKNQFIHLTKVAKKYYGIIKITSDQRISILGLREEDVDAIWREIHMGSAVLFA